MLQIWEEQVCLSNLQANASDFHLRVRIYEELTFLAILANRDLQRIFPLK